MTNGQRGGLAIAFVAAIGVLLAGPVLNAEEGDAPSTPPATAAPTEEPSEEPSEEPLPTEEPTEEPTEAPTEEPPAGLPDAFTETVPDGCLEAEALPEPGSVATFAPSEEIEVASLSGGAATQIDVEGSAFPLGFSPSGSYLAYGAPSLVTADGGEIEGPSGGPYTQWAWSPQSDCLLALSEEQSLVAYEPEGETVPLLDAGVAGFTIAPSGGRVAVFAADGTIGMYNLRSGRLIAQSESGPQGTIVPLGWSGRNLFAGLAQQQGLDVARIRAGGGTVSIADIPALLLPGTMERCGDLLLGVDPRERLVNVRTAEPFGDSAFRYGRPSCSPDSSFVAAPRRPRDSQPSAFRLAILDSNGGFVQEVGTGGGGAEGLPDWGPSGVVYLRQTGRQQAQLIYAQTDDIGPLGPQVGSRPVFDWSATPPSGIPGV